MVTLSDKTRKLIIIMCIICIIFIILGIIGLILINNEETNKIKPIEKPQQNGIVYKYFLENEEVDQMPQNKTITKEDGTTTTEELYIYKKYSCTNNLNGEFNKEEWKFIPEKETKDTCSIYFVKAKYNVKLNLTNAMEDETNSNTINREENAIFKIIPNDGYIFKDVSCTNNKEATWNDKNNTLTLDVVMQDTECNVNFEKKQLKINLIVKNGSGSITETVYYGDNKTIIATPNTGYNNGSVTCTNNQLVTFDNNIVSLEKLTDNTTCTLTYKKQTLKTFTLTMEDITNNNNVSLVSEKIQSIKENEIGKIILRTNNDIPQLDCGSVIPNIKEIESTDGAKTIEYSFHNMQSNITCRIN